MSEALWITEGEVVSLLALPEVIEALRWGLGEQAAGRASNMTKTQLTWGGGSTLHAIGALFESGPIVGTKTWTHTKGGANPLLLLFDAGKGKLLAVIEAFALGQMRTAGISGLATDHLADSAARTMAMIGTGKQSLAQVAAVAAVRPLERVAIRSPTEANRRALAEKVRDRLSLEAVAAGSLEEALAGASVVTLATRAGAPFISRDALATGVHLNAIGAIGPDRIEFEPQLLDRATVCAADSISQVRRLSREFMAAFDDDEAKWTRLRPLSELVATRFQRPADADLTVFKAMGMGISDLSVGIEALRRARAKGMGRQLTSTTFHEPRLRLDP